MVKKEVKQKIIGLSCGRKYGNCETLLKAAAQGASEFGVETELIRAMSLKVLPCRGCFGCLKTGKCVDNDDIEWILQKTCLEECALIVAVPCYHVRANGFLTCINEKMNHLFQKDPEILRKTKVGGIIGVGGSGYDAWASLNLTMINIFFQHTRILVDQIQVNFCALQEWNLWLQDKSMTAEHINELRVEDIPYDDLYKRWPQKYDLAAFQLKALERARQLGRNVAKAMSLPIDKVKYVGEDYAVHCPVCHGNVIVIPKDFPYVMCPVCSIRGKTYVVNGRIKIRWNNKDAKNPRFSPELVRHHFEWLAQHNGPDFASQMRMQKISKELDKYCTPIAPIKQ